MKKILNLTGVNVLSKTDQKEISGAAINRPYCGSNGKCCISFGNGYVFCDFGYCQSNGSCTWA